MWYWPFTPAGRGNDRGFAVRGGEAALKVPVLVLTCKEDGADKGHCWAPQGHQRHPHLRGVLLTSWAALISAYSSHFQHINAGPTCTPESSQLGFREASHWEDNPWGRERKEPGNRSLPGDSLWRRMWSFDAISKWLARSERARSNQPAEPARGRRADASWPGESTPGLASTACQGLSLGNKDCLALSISYVM